MPSLQPDLVALAPEIILATTLFLALLLDLTLAPRDRRLTAWLALAGLTFAGGRLLGGPAASADAFSGMVATGPMAAFFKGVFLLAAAGTIAIGYRSHEIGRSHHGEFHVLVLAATLGMFLMASATDLVMVYLAVEIVSQTSYVLAGYIRGEPRSSEGALKYVLYGGVASGAMIFGISLLYGLTGATDLRFVGQQLAGGAGGGPAAMVALLLVFVGLGFKVSMVPFHMWAPDAYEGAPAPVTAFLSIGSKAAGFALLLRVLLSASALQGAGAAARWVDLPDVPWQLLVAVLSVLTMTVGNLSAIGQRSLKRLLAFSSVAHAGYLLAACAAASVTGLSAVLFYFAVYFLMNIGAFWVVAIVSRAAGRDDDRDYAGLGWRHPLLAAAMSVFLVSLVGLPPTAGFVGKWYLFSALVERGSWKFMLLATAALANSVVSLYYYVYVIKRMWLEEPRTESPPVRAGFVPAAALAALSLLVAYPFSYTGRVMRAAEAAARAAAAPARQGDAPAPRPER